MSEVFDPNKVERWEFWANADEGDMELNPKGNYVLASEFDKLNAMFQDMKVALGMGPDEPITSDDANHAGDQIPGCSFNYGSDLDRQFNPPNGTPRPKH